MKSKKIRRIAFAVLTLTLVLTGIKSYAACIECVLQANPGKCMNGSCNYLNEFGDACCGNTI
jgi:hypothetical protein